MKQYDVIKPACFNRFSCKGGMCRHNCCCGWSITMSRDEYRRLKRKVPGIKGKIRLVADENRSQRAHYEMILSKEENCPYLTDEKLCALQAEHGPEILTGTCSGFPRTYHRYINELEYSLSLGCEKVLEILLEEKEGIAIIRQQEGKPDNLLVSSQIMDKDRKNHPAVPFYFEIQSLCISLLQAGDADIEERMMVLGMALFHIDEMIKEDRAAEIPSYIAAYLDTMETMDAKGQLNGINTENLGVLYYNLTNATKYSAMTNTLYFDMVERIRRKLQVEVEKNELPKQEGLSYETLKCSVEVYRSCQEQFKLFRKSREPFIENIMIAFLFFSNTPFNDLPGGVWKNYTYFVWVYSMMKFCLTMLMEADSTDEEMIDCCVTLFRNLGHNRRLYNEVTASFETNESNSLAHMVVLLNS